MLILYIIIMKSFHFIVTIKIYKINIKCSEFVYNTYSTILQIEMLNSTIHGEHIFIAQYFVDLHKGWNPYLKVSQLLSFHLPDSEITFCRQINLMVIMSTRLMCPTRQESVS